MQVRVCPKCSAENDQAKAACWMCRTSLEDVPLTEKRQPKPAATPTPITQQPLAGPTLAPTPDTGHPIPVTQSSSPDFNPPIPPSPPAYNPGRRLYGGQDDDPPPRAPVEIPWTLIIVVAIALLVGFGYKLVLRPSPPPSVPADTVMRSFVEAKKTGEIAKVKPFLSAESIYRIEHTLNSKQAKSAGFTREDVEKMLLWNVPPALDDLQTGAAQVYAINDTTLPKNKAVVGCKVTTSFHGLPMVSSDETIFVAEDSKWKVDLPATARHRLTGGVLQGQ
jgi:hypothetical protein